MSDQELARLKQRVFDLEVKLEEQKATANGRLLQQQNDQKEIKRQRKEINALKSKLGQLKADHELWIVSVLFPDNEEAQSKALRLLNSTRVRLGMPRKLLGTG